MRILALSDYMELDSAIEQVHYANSFPGVEVKLRCNMSPYQVEQIMTAYSCPKLYPACRSALLSMPPCGMYCNTRGKIILGVEQMTLCCFMTRHCQTGAPVWVFPAK